MKREGNRDRREVSRQRRRKGGGGWKEKVEEERGDVRKGGGGGGGGDNSRKCSCFVDKKGTRTGLRLKALNRSVRVAADKSQAANVGGTRIRKQQNSAEEEEWKMIFRPHTEKVEGEAQKVKRGVCGIFSTLATGKRTLTVNKTAF